MNLVWRGGHRLRYSLFGFGSGGGGVGLREGIEREKRMLGEGFLLYCFLHCFS